MPSVKNAHADRSHGGPGSSHQDATQPDQPAHHGKSAEGLKDPNPPRSRVSGGGGEQDKRHSHSPEAKTKS